MQVSQEITQTIQQQIKRIEEEQQVKILYACESGSRAWGFPSPDSDYDVRFIYVHPPEWYLSIFERRDVIEYPISDELDINGWDLVKALNLFRKSNPPLLEWLHSPIVYSEYSPLAEQIRNMSPLGFSPRACMYHYLHMAKGNFRGYLQGENIRIKKYFYVLRPILSCYWIEQKGSMPPAELQQLVAELLPKGQLRQDIEVLLERKMAGEQLNMESPILSIHQYLETSIADLEVKAALQPVSQQKMDHTLDQLFRDILRQVWS
ncbi:nucleotidyltransferase domain-containing protein [Paenibacillus bovis]|uniref:Nucleotidyltransferase n=1 Tax=Paenibacillus bovis TaxID=1616788 RepID=A0A172ZFG2_9BACL|nr:nucleotidyltransferase domain-containing protein [Paenibacillus bovis]ANF95890.1 hypothetical protein AR543_07640 [Paenibacillus bovis]